MCSFNFFITKIILFTLDRYIIRVLGHYLKILRLLGFGVSTNMEDALSKPSKPNRRKLTLGDFQTIIMTQITSPDQTSSSLLPSTSQRKTSDCE